MWVIHDDERFFPSPRGVNAPRSPAFRFGTFAPASRTIAVELFPLCRRQPGPVRPTVSVSDFDVNRQKLGRPASRKRTRAPLSIVVGLRGSGMGKRVQLRAEKQRNDDEFYRARRSFGTANDPTRPRSPARNRADRDLVVRPSRVCKTSRCRAIETGHFSR